MFNFKGKYLLLHFLLTLDLLIRGSLRIQKAMLCYKRSEIVPQVLNKNSKVIKNKIFDL